MGQRLGIASALLGDPATLILDEPVNGLDPEGIRWIRDLLKGLAAEGRTVFVSTHLMSEMALTADHLDRRRPRPADRRHARRRVHRAGVGATPCSSARPHAAALRDGCSPAPDVDRRQHRARRARRQRPHRRRRSASSAARPRHRRCTS